MTVAAVANTERRLPRFDSAWWQRAHFDQPGSDFGYQPYPLQGPRDGQDAGLPDQPAHAPGQPPFFIWIKPHPRIKKFLGTSENAVKTQFWIAVSVYGLVAIVKKRLGLDASLYTLLPILSLTLFEKIPILQALS